VDECKPLVTGETGDVGYMKDTQGDKKERMKLKDDLDDQNDEYLQQVAARRRLRVRRDIASEAGAHTRSHFRSTSARLDPFPLDLSLLCPQHNPTQPVNVSQRCSC
jgi:hypothetical protein